jgi:malate synthase
MTDETLVDIDGLRVEQVLFDFVKDEALPGTGVTSKQFWGGLAQIVETLGPRQRELLNVRDRIQNSIDEWHRQHSGEPHDAVSYRELLTTLGYLVPCGDPFSIDTTNVDPEISKISGPQLVVPSTNARYVLNAANARWNSLYDALYGTDALGDLPEGGPYDPARGARIVDWVRAFLDDVVPFEKGSHRFVVSYRIEDGTLVAVTQDGSKSVLKDPHALLGFRGTTDAPSLLLLEHNNLGIEIVIDPASEVGSSDSAGICDVILESAITSIVDFEDSVTTVDGDDKVVAYRNWLGLMNGDLTESVTKSGRTFVRRLADDRTYTGTDGETLVRRGRSLLLARNVGHLMTTPTVLDAESHPVYEGMVDAMVTGLAALHDRARPVTERNSPAGSVYIVKPKMHGPEEVALTADMFVAVEQVLGLPENTLKLGIMDEERRTTVNLMECIRAAKSRVAFINTGFLDRTGDEIHTSMLAGPMVRKADMRSQHWIRAYEDGNVDVGLACGLGGRAQIGKGMWTAPDRMAEMLELKICHPVAGANCAWVPSPTAATLHATHYHRVDVHKRQCELAGSNRATVDDLLTIPMSPSVEWTEAERIAEVENNVQGILGYVVRWVEQGVGCSKVPDINGVALMEDRATCRISSQHIANWLLHGVVSDEQVREAFRRMAVVVDAQNVDDPLYVPMAPTFNGYAFRAATDLVFEGTTQPSGYTEPILYAYRAKEKKPVE